MKIVIKNTESVRKDILKQGMNMRQFAEKINVTQPGQYIIELLNGQRKITGKPKAQNVVDRTVPERQPVTPMSDYWKYMFEWSTRHLRRDA